MWRHDRGQEDWVVEYRAQMHSRACTHTRQSAQCRRRGARALAELPRCRRLPREWERARSSGPGYGSIRQAHQAHPAKRAHCVEPLAMIMILILILITAQVGFLPVHVPLMVKARAQLRRRARAQLRAHGRRRCENPPPPALPRVASCACWLILVVQPSRCTCTMSRCQSPSYCARRFGATPRHTAAPTRTQTRCTVSGDAN